MQAVTAQLKGERGTGSAGGGMIEIEANGLGEVLRLKIDPVLIERGQREMIEELVPVAINDAVVKARQLHMEAMKSMTDGLDMPGLDDALKQFTGGGR
jgi:DNA-binding YbaB/EbfC family protein